MRNTRSRKITFLLSACFSALLVLIAAGIAPAFSDDAESVSRQPAAQVAEDATEADATEREPVAAGAHDDATHRLRDLQSDGYEWSATRTAADRYLWSHRPR